MINRREQQWVAVVSVVTEQSIAIKIKSACAVRAGAGCVCGHDRAAAFADLRISLAPPVLAAARRGTGAGSATWLGSASYRIVLFNPRQSQPALTNLL